MDLLDTYTHDWELQVITALSLILHISQITTLPAKTFDGLLYVHQQFPGNGF
jgi:hypothetical protein